MYIIVDIFPYLPTTCQLLDYRKSLTFHVLALEPDTRGGTNASMSQARESESWTGRSGSPKRPTSESSDRDWRAQMRRQLTAIVERDGNGYVALCPEVDVASQGDSVAEARSNLEEALGLFFETASTEENREAPAVVVSKPGESTCG